MSYKSASLSVFHAHSQKGAEFLIADSPGPVMRYAPGTTKSLAFFHFRRRSSHIFASGASCSFPAFSVLFFLWQRF